MFRKTQTYSLIAAHFTATDEKEKIFFAKNVPNIFSNCYISARKGVIYIKYVKRIMFLTYLLTTKSTRKQEL